MDLSPGLAGPGPIHFLRAWAQNFEKGPGLSLAPTQLVEKGLESWSFYGVKLEAGQGSGLNFFEEPGLGFGWSSTFKARDWPGLKLLGLNPFLLCNQI